jgi:hypothetical protein
LEAVLAAEFQKAQKKEVEKTMEWMTHNGGQGRIQAPTLDNFITATNRTSECNNNARMRVMQAWFILFQSSHGSRFMQIQPFPRRSFFCHF